ncbi:MAG: hypothetical protein Salg2KO_03030 [Salibacteraceae bacterium]
MLHKFLLATGLAICLISCGGQQGETGEESTEEGTNELPRSLQVATTTVDLSDHYVNGTLIVPDETQGELSISVNDFGETHVQVGEVYHVVFAELLEGDINSRKQALGDDLMYKNEFVEEGEDFILYKSVIADSHLDPEFHFYAVKTIGNTTFEIHDYNEQGGYAESIARRMLESVKNIKPNNSPS